VGVEPTDADAMARSLATSGTKTTKRTFAFSLRIQFVCPSVEAR
jgi:hypothetical protein